MGFSRIRNPRLAAWVAAGVNRYNRLRISAQRVLCRPHYVIVSDRKVVGWLGLEARGRRTYELTHLSVLPQYRRRGHAKTAVRRSLAMIRSVGGKQVYVRIRRNNLASMALARSCGMRRGQARGSVVTYWRSV
ncbi:MAG: GNAT family N-acetyltransferase [Bacillota bacterium]|jgi:predicted acetyltransferase